MNKKRSRVERNLKNVESEIPLRNLSRQAQRVGDCFRLNKQRNELDIDAEPPANRLHGVCNEKEKNKPAYHAKVSPIKNNKK